MSSLCHALLLTGVIPLFQYMPRITPEPFRLTISLVEPFDSPSEELSTSPNHVNRPMTARTSEGQPFVPPPPSATALHESKPGSQLRAAIREQVRPLAETVESHAVPGPKPLATGLPNRNSLSAPAPAFQQHTPPLAEMSRNLEAPATRIEPAGAQEIATEQPIQQAVEPAPHSTSRSFDQPIRTAPVAPVTPSDAEAPAASPSLATGMSVAAAPAVSTARDDGESSASSAQTRPRTDYGWLQLALSRRLEELKRSVRPSIEESGRLRVLVKAVVSNTGELMEAEIVNSSGHHRIDQDAMTLVQRAFPMSLDQDLDRPQIVMRIPITFSRD